LKHPLVQVCLKFIECDSIRQIEVVLEVSINKTSVDSLDFMFDIKNNSEDIMEDWGHLKHPIIQSSYFVKEIKFDHKAIYLNINELLQPHLIHLYLHIC